VLAHAPRGTCARSRRRIRHRASAPPGRPHRSSNARVAGASQAGLLGLELGGLVFAPFEAGELATAATKTSMGSAWSLMERDRALAAGKWNPWRPLRATASRTNENSPRREETPGSALPQVPAGCEQDAGEKCSAGRGAQAFVEATPRCATQHSTGATRSTSAALPGPAPR